MLRSERDIIRAISRDEWMMGVIGAARSLDLPDWWICAGFVRSKIWDMLHGYGERTPLPDVDVVYFDPERKDEEYEKMYERRLQADRPDIPWSVKNQARMHAVNGNPPYTSAVDGISKFPESATALGVKMTAEGKLILTAPCGVEDALGMRVKPSPYFQTRPDLIEIYRRRVGEKNWRERWPLLTYDPAGGNAL